MSKKVLLSALVSAFALLLAVACSKANAPETSKPSAAAGSTSAPAQSSATPASTPVASAMKIDLKVDPAEPNPSKPAKFTAKVTDADGKPVTGADVNVSLVMKTMDMGKNEVKLADEGNGNYEGQAKFGMSGDWDVVVTAKQGGKSASQTFPVKSVMPKP